MDERRTVVFMKKDDSMGRFVNPDNSAFQTALNSEIYIDKTGLLEYTTGHWIPSRR